MNGDKYSFYRPDIDGLRTLAVVPVILFHANLACSGGFVGVDVFFVISGYLITSIINKDIVKGDFSILSFYERRIRRIFPAMFAMILFSLLFALMTFPPDDLKRFGQSVLATAIFSANILDYRHFGYFDTDAQHDPLLHMWTLAVEEQFYIFWPLLLVGVRYFARVELKILIIGCIFGCSLLLSSYWVNHSPIAAFYLLPSRAWELAMGAALAMPRAKRLASRLPPRLAHGLSLLGPAMILIAAATYDSIMPFPGFAALVPCFGASLVIITGYNGLLIGGRILSFRPLVWIGGLSYSLYVWHWPILVFAKLDSNQELSLADRLGLLVIIFAVAWLSWRFIERPFRDKRIMPGSNRIWVAGGLVTASVFVIFGAVLYGTNGLAARSPDLVQWVQAAKEEGNAFQRSQCLVRGGDLPNLDGCLLGAPSNDSRYSAVLWGDSHAAQFAPAIDAIGKELGLTVREVTKAGCAAVPGVSFLPVNEARVACPSFNDNAMKAILADKRMHTIIMASRWDSMIEGDILLTTDGSRPSLDRSRELLTLALRRTIDALRESGREVILIGQVPVPDESPIDCIARARFNRHSSLSCDVVTAGAHRGIDDAVTHMLRAAIIEHPEVPIIFPFKKLCHDDYCDVVAGNQRLYMDDSHLSAFGAKLATSDMEASLAWAERQHSFECLASPRVDQCG